MRKLTKAQEANKARFIEAAATHWNAAIATGKHPGEVLYACLDAAAGKQTVAQADKMRKLFLQALTRAE